MNIHEYFNTHDTKHIAKVASQAGTSLQYLQQYKYGKRRISADLAIWLEHVTGGELTARELRPDLPWPHRLPDPAPRASPTVPLPLPTAVAP